MDPNKRRTLELLGWPGSILDSLERSDQPHPTDKLFLEGINEALAAGGIGALQLLAVDEGASIADLVRHLPRVNKWICTAGLTMAIYREAAERGTVRDIAKDLLIRRIREVFPDGWCSDGNVHPSVRIGSWDRDIQGYVGDPSMAVYAIAIVNDLAVDNPPPNGWKAQVKNDPFVDDLFDRLWPMKRGEWSSDV
jgi:hypothetical protein